MLMQSITDLLFLPSFLLRRILLFFLIFFFDSMESVYVSPFGHSQGKNATVGIVRGNVTMGTLRW